MLFLFIPSFFISVFIYKKQIPRYNLLSYKQKRGICLIKIITILITILNTINKFIWKFIIFLSKFIPPDDIKNINSKPDDIRYRQLNVDEPAIIEVFKQPEKLDYKLLIKENNIKPVKRRIGKTIPTNIRCISCNATHEYLYDNNGKLTQFECKVCSVVFSTNPNPFKDVLLKCPHCKYHLSLKHERADFNVYKCNNMKCSFYLSNKNSMNVVDKDKFKKNPTLFKLHYIYRAFNIDTPSITKDFRDFVRSPIDISKAYNSHYAIGLCLTYHVNYGLSYRQTAAILYDIHELKISHQTVANYCKAVSAIIHPVLEYYPYELSNTIAGDETYIKIKGKTNYVFFMFDAIKKIITSYRVFDKRDAISAIKTTYSTLAKYDTIPESLKFITDGNPIYNVAHQYWNQNGFSFDLFQVIGLKNTDPISGKYRSYKQIIERHNRTFKYYYRPTNGLSSIYDANSYMILFSSCFNFLRLHSSLEYKVPVHDQSIQSMPNMPAKWLALIELGYKYTKLYH